jgi:hypothetical protein
MIKLKSADRIKIKTLLGFREVKGELYRGFGINKDYYKLNNLWHLTVLEGDKKGWCLAECRKKNDCRLLADEIIKKIGKTEIMNSDIYSLRDTLEKYSVKE